LRLKVWLGTVVLGFLFLRQSPPAECEIQHHLADVGRISCDRQAIALIGTMAVLSGRVTLSALRRSLLFERERCRVSQPPAPETTLLAITVMWACMDRESMPYPAT
jgi:hypothetical protein